jgi:ABC-type transport system involved in cytochrome c biogenesis permease subunit
MLLRILSPLAYLVSAVYFFFYFSKRQESSLKIANKLNILAICIHLMLLIVLTVNTGHLPLTGIFKALSTFMFFFAILNKFFVRESNDYSLGLFYAVTLFIFQSISMIFISISTTLPSVLNDRLFEIHVIINLIGYAAFSSAFLVALMYVLLFHEIKSKKLGYFYDRLPSLVYLERINYQAIIVGFIFITIGIISGAITGISAWGKYWDWDPKLISVLITWIFYGLAILGKKNYRWHGKSISYISLVGFIWIIFSMLIITRYFSGIHSFN